MNKHLLSLALAVVSFSALARGGVGVNLDLFNSNSGTGYVPKLTLAVADPAGVSFKYQITTTYTAFCSRTTGHVVKGAVTLVHTDGVVVNSLLDNRTGGRHAFAGYSLTGYGAPFSSGATIPVVGSKCKGKGRWVTVTQTGSDGGLYATYGTTDTLLQ
jgi:hypothetical protein